VNKIEADRLAVSTRDSFYTFKKDNTGAFVSELSFGLQQSGVIGFSVANSNYAWVAVRPASTGATPTVTMYDLYRIDLQKSAANSGTARLEKAKVQVSGLPLLRAIDPSTGDLLFVDYSGPKESIKRVSLTATAPVEIISATDSVAGRIKASNPSLKFDVLRRVEYLPPNMPEKPSFGINEKARKIAGDIIGIVLKTAGQKSGEFYWQRLIDALNRSLLPERKKIVRKLRGLDATTKLALGIQGDGAGIKGLDTGKFEEMKFNISNDPAADSGKLPKELVELLKVALAKSDCDI
jgi:hypothetical protein